MKNFLLLFLFLPFFAIGQRSDCTLTKVKHIEGMNVEGNCTFIFSKPYFFLCKWDSQTKMFKQVNGRYVSEFTLLVDTQKEEVTLSFSTRNQDSILFIPFTQLRIKKNENSNFHCLAKSGFNNYLFNEIAIRKGNFSAYLEDDIYITTDEKDLFLSNFIDYQYFKQQDLEIIKNLK